jgi:hypothetical protein
MIMARKVRVAKSKRHGLGKGSGSGYRNMIPTDPRVHSQSAKGLKQPQRFMPIMPKPTTEELKEIKDGVYEYKGYIIEIMPHEVPESPREWDNLGTMATFHSRYDLGDKVDFKSEQFDSWDEMANYIEKEKGAVVILPVYLYDHSGLRMSTGDFHDRWDSGQVGYIYVTKEDIVRKYGKDTPENREKARNVLKREIETYDQYLTGDVWGYKVTDPKGEELDSVWGYYGQESAIDEAKSVVNYDMQRQPPAFQMETTGEAYDED